MTRNKHYNLKWENLRTFVFIFKGNRISFDFLIEVTDKFNFLRANMFCNIQFYS